MYFKKIQTTLLKLLYQTGPYFLFLNFRVEKYDFLFPIWAKIFTFGIKNTKKIGIEIRDINP